MTATVNQATRLIVIGTGYGVTSITLVAVVIAVLFLLLVEKEILRSPGQAWGRRAQQGLNIAAVPLLLAFGTIVAVRLAVTVFRQYWG